ncbi:MAG: hypothetical protein NVS3B18_08720 [Candidatus Dormibacteria bacterium]
MALAVAGPTLRRGPATAAAGGYCSASGVNVAIDFGALGGGVQKGCGTGSVAAAAIQSAGFPLGYIQTGGMSGFVCTVSGKPAPSQGGCTGANGNGYWALFIASPGGQWSYANLGANSQPVNSGQTVSFAWQAPGGGQRDPGTAPAARIAPEPTFRPTPKPKPPLPSSAAAAVTAAKTPSAASTPRSSAAPRAVSTAHPAPSASPTASPSTWSSAAPAPSANVDVTAPSSGRGGLPWWIPIGVVAALLLGSGATWWRKRAGG